jgi:hypothetical protein
MSEIQNTENNPHTSMKSEISDALKVYVHKYQY